jgi:hypothetical protein
MERRHGRAKRFKIEAEDDFYQIASQTLRAQKHRPEAGTPEAPFAMNFSNKSVSRGSWRCLKGKAKLL